MDDDRTLYRRWLTRRDADAFATLARRHADLAHDVAFRVAGDRGAAEDALQEALIRLATDGTPRPAEIGVRAWLAQAAISRARSARHSERARARRERAVGEARKETTVDAQPDVDSEAVQDVEQALRRVDEEDAAILALRFRHGVEYAELAAILDISEGAARVRVHRATEALRRDAGMRHRDGPAIERALGGVPVVTAPSAALTSAIDAAMGAAVAPTAGAGGAAAVASGGGLLASVVALVPGGLVTLLAAGIVVAGGVIAFARSGDEGRRAEPGVDIARSDAGRKRGDGLPPTAAELAARPRGLGSAMENGLESRPDASQSSSADPQSTEIVKPSPAIPGKPSPEAVPASRPASAGNSAGASLARPPPKVYTPRVRAEVVSPEGTPIPVAIDLVTMRGVQTQGSVVERDGLRIETSAGRRTVVNVKTADPRALVPWIRVFMSEPVPDTLVARFPAASDPRLDPLVIEVLDATSGAPIPGAQFDWQRPGTRSPTTTADAAGRIVVAAATAEDGALERGSRALVTRGFAIHSPGLRTFGSAAWPSEAPVALDQPLADAWIASGTWVVRLERLPVDCESKTARVLFDDGRPAAGVLVCMASIAPSAVVRALGAAITPNDVDVGLRRAGPDGQIEFGARLRTAMEIFIDDCPVGVFALSRDRWPASGPREIRLAPLAEVTIAIGGVPEPGSWMFDPLGAARTPSDGSMRPTTWDDGFDPKTREGEFSILTFQCQPDLSGDLKPGRTEIRFRYPVGWDRPLYVRAGNALRQMVVKAPAAGPIHLDVNWDQMEASTSR